MDCRHSILINNDWLYLKINTSGDYIYKRNIPKKEWLQLWRYEIGFLGEKNSGRKFWINKSS